MKSKNKNKTSQFNNMVTKQQLKQILSSQNKKLLKYVDTVTALTGATSFMSPIGLPTLGATQTSTIGEKFTVDKIDLRWNYLPVVLATMTSAHIRIIVWQSRIPAAASPVAIAAFLQYSGNRSNINSPFDYENNKNIFSIISDSCFAITQFDTNSRCGKFSLKPAIKDVVLDQAGGLYTKGALFCTVVYSDAAGHVIDDAAFGVSFDWTARVWFHDV